MVGDNHVIFWLSEGLERLEVCKMLQSLTSETITGAVAALQQGCSFLLPRECSAGSYHNIRPRPGKDEPGP